MARWTGRLLVLAATALLAVTAGPCAAFASLPGVLPPAPRQSLVAGFGADAPGAAGPAVTMRLDPALPDGSYGWYVSPANVWLSADGRGRMRYQWDGTDGAWRPYDAPIVVPEGKHVLYAQAFDGNGSRGPIVALPVKLSLTTRPLGEYRTFVTAAVAPPTRQGAVRVVALIQPPVGPRVVRVWGNDRYGTSREISRTNWDHAGTVIITRGDLFPDALAAGGLSGILDAPILLTQPARVSTQILGEIQGLRATHAVVIGDTKAVSAHAEAQIRALGLSVERVGGADRYATAAAVARSIVARGGRRGAAMLARGDLFPDALALSPFAFHDRCPLLLVRPTAISAETSRAIGDLGITQVVIAGDTRSVSAGVESRLQAMGVMTERHGGGDRYETAREVARWGTAAGWGSWSFLAIATGERFPDALCGGVAAGHKGGVLLMTNEASLNPLVAAEMGAHGADLREVQVYGGERAVSKTVWDTILKIVR